MGEELIAWGQENLNVEINEMWGQTEFNYLVGNCSEVMEVRPGSMGRPYPGHDMTDGQKLREDWFPVLWPRNSEQ